MTCDEVLSKISPYYDGELEPAQHAQVASHLDDCPTCRAYFQGVAQIGEWLRGDRACEVPDGLWGRIAEAVQRATAPLADAFRELLLLGLGQTRRVANFREVSRQRGGSGVLETAHAATPMAFDSDRPRAAR